MRDPLGAFCAFHDIRIEGAPSGPLAGLTFGAKETFDIAGHSTGMGSPEFLASRPPARETAQAVLDTLAAGATLVGKTHCDELCFSLEGENAHYGTPVNPRAPGRIPGGSSSGSAAAVAGELVDFALGTDAGGSVRIPASLTGLYGIRPTHRRISSRGTVPLAPSIGTVGWLAREPELFARIGTVLLGADAGRLNIKRLALASDLAALAEPRVLEALRPHIAHAAARLGVPLTSMAACPEGIDRWFTCVRTIQGFEAWQTHGPWITERKPRFSPLIAERFQWASTVTAAQAEAERAQRPALTRSLEELLGDDTLLVFPTAPAIAPVKNAPPEVLNPFRGAALKLCCVSGLSGLPQVSVPVATLDGCPIGLSFLAPRNTDRALLAAVEALGRFG